MLLLPTVDVSGRLEHQRRLVRLQQAQQLTVKALHHSHLLPCVRERSSALFPPLRLGLARTSKPCRIPDQPRLHHLSIAFKATLRHLLGLSRLELHRPGSSLSSFSSRPT